MATEKVLHMNGGVGQNSYANNSFVQRKVIMKAKPILKEHLTRVYKNMLPDCLKIADLGCASGSNTLLIASEIIDIIDEISLRLKEKTPAFQIFLNDLPSNDFNTIFQSLPDFYNKLQQEKGLNFGPCFIVGVPGSFYGRLFPENSIHFFHSSLSVHWLSQVPKGLSSNAGEALNKDDIYISNKSPGAVWKAYVEQFEQDFLQFLRHRSVELVNGGSMLLTLLGRLENQDPTTTFNIIGMALHDLVLQNKIEEAKLECFDIPYYGPTEKEVRKIIEREGSFRVERIEIIKLGWDADMMMNIESEDDDDDDDDNIINDNMNMNVCEDMMMMKAKFIANYTRAVTEPLLKMHFGEEIMDELFFSFTHKLLQLINLKKLVYTILLISITKNIS